MYIGLVNSSEITSPSFIVSFASQPRFSCSLALRNSRYSYKSAIRCYMVTETFAEPGVILLGPLARRDWSLCSLRGRVSGGPSDHDNTRASPQSEMVSRCGVWSVRHPGIHSIVQRGLLSLSTMRHKVSLITIKVN